MRYDSSYTEAITMYVCTRKKKKKKKEERNRQETWRFSTVEIVYRLLEEVLPFLLGRWCGQRCLTAPHAVAVVTCREKKESLELIVKIDITLGHYIYIYSCIVKCPSFSQGKLLCYALCEKRRSKLRTKNLRIILINSNTCALDWIYARRDREKRL